jgi:hypothetical protein
MLPGRCGKCGGQTGRFYKMKKDGQILNEVCPRCKENLEKDGWKVVAQGMH